MKQEFPGGFTAKDKYQGRGHVSYGRARYPAKVKKMSKEKIALFFFQLEAV